MKTPLLSFNIYLMLAAILLVAGCTSTAEKEKKELSTLRVFVEASPDPLGGTGQVEVTKQKYRVTINREPILTEGDVDRADIVEGIGGPEMQIVFNAHGALLLDMSTTENKTRRLVIMTQSPETHWLAFKVIREQISNGVLQFTPDPAVTRPELDRIIEGLNKVAKKAKKLDRGF